MKKNPTNQQTQKEVVQNHSSKSCLSNISSSGKIFLRKERELGSLREAVSECGWVCLLREQTLRDTAAEAQVRTLCVLCSDLSFLLVLLLGRGFFLNFFISSLACGLHAVKSNLVKLCSQRCFTGSLERLSPNMRLLQGSVPLRCRQGWGSCSLAAAFWCDLQCPLDCLCC